MAIVTSDPLSLGETLSAMLAAVIDAQTQAARATVDFIEDVGIVDVTEGTDTAQELRHVSFKYKKFDENFETKEFVLEVPLLSMVDIPVLTVKAAKFEFNYQITKTTKPPASLKSTSSSAIRISEATPLSRDLIKPATITGAIKKKSVDSQSEEKGGLDVTIEIEKASLPVGIDRILEILELAATETKVEDDT